jgi:hypothetical protein
MISINGSGPGFINCSKPRKIVPVMGKRYKFQGLSKWGSRDKQRCGAKLHNKLAACRRWLVPGRTRCRLHGGLSTGARTPEGKARVRAALIDGRQRWLEEMRAKKKAGLIARFPGGRKSGHGWVTARMRQREMESLRAATVRRGMTPEELVRAAASRLRELRRLSRGAR